MTMTQNYKHILHNFSKSFGEYTTGTRHTDNSTLTAVWKVALIREDN